MAICNHSNYKLKLRRVMRWSPLCLLCGWLDHHGTLRCRNRWRGDHLITLRCYVADIMHSWAIEPGIKSRILNIHGLRPLKKRSPQAPLKLNGRPDFAPTASLCYCLLPGSPFRRRSGLFTVSITLESTDPPISG